MLERVRSPRPPRKLQRNDRILCVSTSPLFIFSRLYDDASCVCPSTQSLSFFKTPARSLVHLLVSLTKPRVVSHTGRYLNHGVFSIKVQGTSLAYPFWYIRSKRTSRKSYFDPIRGDEVYQHPPGAGNAWTSITVNLLLT